MTKQLNLFDDTAAPIAFSIGKVIVLTGLSRTTLYAAIRDGDLRARKYRRRRIILKPDLADFLASLPASGRLATLSEV